MQAVLSGEVSFGFDTAIGSVQRVKSGQVPAITGAGYPAAEVIAWVGLFAPAATPAAMQKILAAALQKLMNDADVKRQFVNLGVEAAYVDGETTMQMMRHEYVRFGKLVEKAKIQAN